MLVNQCRNYIVHLSIYCTSVEVNLCILSFKATIQATSHGSFSLGEIAKPNFLTFPIPCNAAVFSQTSSNLHSSIAQSH